MILVHLFQLQNWQRTHPVLHIFNSSVKNLQVLTFQKLKQRFHHTVCWSHLLENYHQNKTVQLRDFKAACQPHWNHSPSILGTFLEGFKWERFCFDIQVIFDKIFILFMAPSWWIKSHKRLISCDCWAGLYEQNWCYDFLVSLLFFIIHPFLRF